MADCVAHAGVGSERVSRGKVHGLVGRRDSCTMPEIPGGLRFRALFQTLRLPHGDFSFLSTLLRTLFFRARFFSRLFPRRISRCSTRETVYITWRWCVHAADELRAPLRSSIVVDDGTILNERVKVTGEIRPEQLRSRVGHNHGINLSICLQPLLILILLAFSILFFFTPHIFSRFTNAWNILPNLPVPVVFTRDKTFVVAFTGNGMNIYADLCCLLPAS